MAVYKDYDKDRKTFVVRGDRIRSLIGEIVNIRGYEVTKPQTGISNIDPVFFYYFSVKPKESGKESDKMSVSLKFDYNQIMRLYLDEKVVSLGSLEKELADAIDSKKP